MGLDETKLTSEQRDKLEKWNQNKQMITSLEDIASMANEIIQLFDSTKADSKKFTQEAGALLVDMKESMAALKDKEAPEMPDHAKPVVEALSKLEKALTASVKSIDVKPTVKVDAPQVNVDSPSVSVDLKGVEKVLKTDLPKAFKEATKLIPKPQKTDLEPLTKQLEAMAKQLADIDTGVRMKPGGVNAKITNTASNPVPITGTITATVDTAGLATSTKQSDGSQKTQIVDSGGEAATVTGGKLDVNATANLAGETLPVSGATEGVAVAIVDGSGNQITTFGGGTQYTEGDTDASITGTALMVEDASSTLQPAPGDKTNGLDVDVTRSALPTGASTSAKQDTGNTSLASIDGKITAVNTGAVVVASGSITANAGTNLNTSALALAATQTDKSQFTKITDGTDTALVTASGEQNVLETNSAAIKTAVEKIDDAISGSEMQVDVVTSALPSGAATATKQDDIITAIGAIPGGGGTQYTEDAAAAANPVGTALNLVREDARAGGLTTTDGDNVAARGNNKGELYVKTTDSDALLTTIDADTSNISTKIDTVAGAVSGTEMQVDVLTSALPSGAATSAKQDTLIGHVDGVEALLGTIDSDTSTLAVVGSGTEATAQRVTIATDSTGVLSVDDNGNSLTVDNAGLTELAAAINSDKVDVNIASSGISLGGTAAADDADFTAGTTPGTPSMGVYESTPTSVTDGDLGTVGITAGRRLKTSATIDAALPAGTNNIGDVDVVSMPTTTVQATNLDIRDLTNADVVTAELSATDNAVLDAIAASTAAIDTDTTTLIGHVDGVETAIASTNTKLDTVNTNLTTIDGRVDGLETSNSAIQTSVQLIDDTIATLGTTTYTEASTKGGIIGAVRRDANTTLVDTTNEVAPLQVNATGELKVAQIQALPAGTRLCCCGITILLCLWLLPVTGR